ncbi:GIY-YIG nuclease family protein [uncultured Tenacibaculum sp.]|uniref:GIY-YIG nuclease family protein n=1 Tax=uncultured Tenacibaculum sp. TaxID=174713 RepID=UPI0026182BED|nr:GIY-YIG nuclease family protein [uncultured Tenacibaculum sp.]
MKNNSKKGILYTVTNKKTKEVYVGITTTSIKARKKDHLQKTISGKQSKFYNSIVTYKIDAFEWESDNTLYVIDELARKEKELISENKGKGISLNMDSGGGIQKSVYKYRIKDGSLVAKFECLDKAANTVEGTKQQVSRACLNKIKYANFYWSYKLKIPFQPKKDNRQKKVIQYSLSSGQVINFFNSIAEASRKTKINKTCIAKCCRNERNSAGGYKWEYESSI